MVFRANTVVFGAITVIGSGFPPTRKLGCNVATGSSLFNLVYSWVSTVPAGADVNEVHVLKGRGGGGISPSSLYSRSLSVAVVWF